MKKIAIIGAGFSGLSSACYLAKAGFEVHMYEKNEVIGGRARYFQQDGFTFDMGPSWYWMPDVFERFFADFNHQVSEFYQLDLLDPGFRIYYGKGNMLDIPHGNEQLMSLFDEIEPGGGKKLQAFMEDAAYKYKVGIEDLVYKPGLKLSELFDKRLLKGIFKLDLLTAFDKFVRKYFKDPRLIRLMEFPVLFLGAAPSATPALYSMMNYAGLILGTWYPQGGMFKIVEGMANLAMKLGVQIHTNSPVGRILTRNGTARGIRIENEELLFDYVISSADYHHSETELLDESKRNYSKKYWDRKVMAPSCILYFLGIDKKIEGLLHHTLFFDEDLDQHIDAIYDHPGWPENPLFYVCCPSKTDSSVSPDSMENLFILIPIASGLEGEGEWQQKYFELVIKRLENITGEKIKDHIVFRRDYGPVNFKQDYHAYRGNAYGLANTLSQTAHLKPKIKNKHLDNFYYTGHLTVPGPGVPPSLISGKIVANQIISNP